MPQTLGSVVVIRGFWTPSLVFNHLERHFGIFPTRLGSVPHEMYARLFP